MEFFKNVNCSDHPLKARTEPPEFTEFLAILSRLSTLKSLVDETVRWGSWMLFSFSFGTMEEKAHSSAFCSSQPYRRIVVLDDSSASSILSDSQRGAVQSSSFLSDDREGEISFVDEAVSREAESEEEGCGNDCFAMSDDEYLTDDASFLSKSESDFSYGEEVVPSTAETVLPQRRAKVDLSGAKMTQRKKPNRTTTRAGKGILCSEESLSELEDCATAPSRALDGDIQLPSSNTPEKVKEESRREKSFVRAVTRSDDTDSSSSDNFESYLKKLREDPAKKKEEDRKNGGHNDSSFIVSDSDVSSATISEVESSDESLSPSDNDDGQGRSQKQKLISSIKDSFNSPSVLSKAKKQVLDADEHFLMSLSANYTGQRHPDAEIYVRKGIKNEKLRMELTSRLFDIFRKQCFKYELPEFLPVKWNNRLCKTAGMCRNMSDRTSWVELSPKVCSTPDRVRDTLIHELCHAAVWILDGRRKEGHGPLWKKWAAQCMQRFPSLPVIARCHDYDIEAKFIYECGGCGQKVKRHSKSLNIDKKICGICKCRFTLQVRTTKKGTAADDSSELNPFAKFVKENYGKYKGPGVQHGQVMRILAQLYKERTSLNDSAKNTAPKEPLDMSVTECPESLDMSVLSIHD
ncbi:SprT domain-containing protein [Trichostrongylus colubriformis]|uniref:SprT domain-containing protein n=1 Tax=Trichostrongylus colubriformis TaxID=6319 RepID=A0AAN8FPE0_TRICO